MLPNFHNLISPRNPFFFPSPFFSGVHVNVLSEKPKNDKRHKKRGVREEMQKQKEREREREEKNTLQRYLLRWKRRETDKEGKEPGESERQR